VLLIGHQQKAQTQKIIIIIKKSPNTKKKKKKILRGFGHFGGSKGISVIFLSFNCFFIIL
jgi:hypothetical protein